MPKGKQRGGRGRGGHNRRDMPPPRQRRQPDRAAKKSLNNSKWTSSNAAQIEEYMASHGVVRKPIVGDGNCLFRAMADQLGYGENQHREIRERIVQTIQEDKDYFANFIDADEVDSVDAYCEEMINDGIVV
jgi:OTU domain-containing protein 3